MRPSHRLDVLAVPQSPSAAPIDELREFLRTLTEQEVLDGRGGPGPNSARWMPEGFARVRLDLPDRITLYANRQGGFRVFCPVGSGPPITDAFVVAYTAARGDERPDLTPIECPTCGGRHTLGETVGRPTFRFARLALQTIDAEALLPAISMVSELQRQIGELAWVGVRT